MDDRPESMLEPAVTDAEVVTTYRRQITGIREIIRTAALRDHIARMLPGFLAELRRAGVRPTGPPVSVIRHIQAGSCEVTLGYPVAAPLDAGAPFVDDHLPGGVALQALHPGPIDSLLSTYDRLSEWLGAHRVPPVPIMWEEYLVGAEATADQQQWWTRLVCPLPPSA